jgi:hypothetical protein
MVLNLFVVGVIAVLHVVVDVVPVVEWDGVAVLLQWVLATGPSD